MSMSVTRGFTLLELLLSIATLSIITSIGIPVYQSFQNRNDIDVAAQAFVQQSRRAMILSRGVDGNSSWGVYATTSAVTLFQGTNYALRNAALDELIEISSTIELSGTQEYVFTKFTGFPTTTGTTVFSHPNNETRIVRINEKGTIQY